MGPAQIKIRERWAGLLLLIFPFPFCFPAQQVQKLPQHFPSHRADGIRRRGGGRGDPGGGGSAGRGAAEGKPGADCGSGHAGDGEDGRLERQLLQGRQRRCGPPRRQPRHLLAVSSNHPPLVFLFYLFHGSNRN